MFEHGHRYKQKIMTQIMYQKLHTFIRTTVLVVATFAVATSTVYAQATTLPRVYTSVSGSVSATSVTVVGTAAPGSSGSVRVWFEWGTSPSLSGYSSTQSENYNTAVNFTETLTGLSPDTTYYYRAVAEGDGQTVKGDTRSFVTLAGTEGTTIKVTTNEPTNVGATSAVLNGEVDPKGDGGVVRWFQWGEGTSLDNSTTQERVGLGDQKFSYTLSGLKVNQLYSYRAIAENSQGVRYFGALRSFVAGGGSATPPISQVPTALRVTTLTAGTTTKTDTILRGQAQSPESVATNGWFEWGTSATDLNNKTTRKSVGSGAFLTFSEPITGLLEGTAYFYRAVAENKYGVEAGQTFVVRTEGQAPVVPTTPITPTKTTTTTKTPTTTTKPTTTTTDETVACAATSTNGNLGAALFGEGFFPDNLIGWLIVLLLIIAIVAVSHHYFGARKKQKEEEKRKKEKVTEPDDIPDFILPGQK